MPWSAGTTPTVSQGFTGSSIFSIAGAPIAKDAATLEAGLDFAIAPRATERAVG
ncbi:hypothetical protein MZK49_28370 [Ensifer sesbaniae]|uniref:hypothetical protein n=1 Tax=Ensifer sesbaniae TaxID=1214071 RepID=UPI001567D375|nr:hypothetical protein [Ensifer sesbaniae]MCK3780598.1 hypothetical protein [Ensifer sesbaniae]